MATTRRQFLCRALAAGGAAVGTSGLQGCIPRIDPVPVADVAAPVNGKLSFPLASYPDLSRDGGALAVRAPGLPAPILVVHPSGTELYALASVCTHAGCPLGYQDGVVCPCHGSRFGLDGTVQNPPAVEGLRTYAVHLDLTSGEVIVDLLAGTRGFPDLVNGTVTFKFADFPALSKPGGSVEGIPGGWGQPLLVMALPDGTFAAVGATCTHLGCTVGYSAAHNDVECPCHGSIFTTGGAVVQGPASLPLPSYPAASDGTAVAVQLQ
jgi:cytochrome b6-f complex iron-sulfur subunit